MLFNQMNWALYKVHSTVTQNTSILIYIYDSYWLNKYDIFLQMQKPF